MKRLTVTNSCALAVLLLCSMPMRTRAQAGNTKITVKDGGSILLQADGMDNGNTWKAAKNELRHLNSQGVLNGVQITEGGVDKCAGDAKCGIDPSQHWTILVNYGGGSVTLGSPNGNRGMRLKLSKNMPLDRWQHTANGNEREFGHGDGNKITGVSVNNGPNLCAGNGCVVSLIYEPR